MSGPSHGEARRVGPLEAQPVRITTCETKEGSLLYTVSLELCFFLSSFSFFSFPCVVSVLPFLGRFSREDRRAAHVHVPIYEGCPSWGKLPNQDDVLRIP